jgi:hypothetical protein
MDEATPERWLPVIGWEGLYEVSDWGRIRSVRHWANGWRGGQILKLRPCPHGGHLQVHLSDSGRRAMAYVHQMVAVAFIGPCPPGEETRHWDGDTENNRPSNLLYGTSAENAQDRVRHGRLGAGSSHPFSTLTDADVAAIRAAWQQGAQVANLAVRYDISKPAVSRIVHGLSYKEVPVLPRAPEKCHYPLCDRDVIASRDSRGKFCDLQEHNNYEAKKARLRIGNGSI